MLKKKLTKASGILLLAPETTSDSWLPSESTATLPNLALVIIYLPLGIGAMLKESKTRALPTEAVQVHVPLNYCQDSRLSANGLPKHTARTGEIGGTLLTPLPLFHLQEVVRRTGYHACTASGLDRVVGFPLTPSMHSRQINQLMVSARQSLPSEA